MFTSLSSSVSIPGLILLAEISQAAMVGISTLMFVAVILVLVIVLLYAKKQLVNAADVTIVINDDPGRQSLACRPVSIDRDADIESGILAHGERAQAEVDRRTNPIALDAHPSSVAIALVTGRAQRHDLARLVLGPDEQIGGADIDDPHAGPPSVPVSRDAGAGIARVRELWRDDRECAASPLQPIAERALALGSQQLELDRRANVGESNAAGGTNRLDSRDMPAVLALDRADDRPHRRGEDRLLERSREHATIDFAEIATCVPTRRVERKPACQRR